jgi:phosphatidylinositol-3,4,5-trisphosphate 3-phosphatase/dual-specificity protein phosphatase PTEN
MSAVQNLIRTIVSGKHHRLVDEQLHVNLDLSYITPRILATSYPASGLETVYRNSAADVAKFLNARHTGRHLILNLSERPYSAESLGERATVLEQGFPDHHAPPLEVAWRSCAAMHAWLLADPENIVVVHCLAGKGRTGVVIACYLIFAGLLAFGILDRLTGTWTVMDTQWFADFSNPLIRNYPIVWFGFSLLTWALVGWCVSTFLHYNVFLSGGVMRLRVRIMQRLLMDRFNVYLSNKPMLQEERNYDEKNTIVYYSWEEGKNPKGEWGTRARMQE